MNVTDNTKATIATFDSPQEARLILRAALVALAKEDDTIMDPMLDALATHSAMKFRLGQAFPDSDEPNFQIVIDTVENPGSPFHKLAILSAQSAVFLAEILNHTVMEEVRRRTATAREAK